MSVVERLERELGVARAQIAIAAAELDGRRPHWPRWAVCRWRATNDIGTVTMPGAMVAQSRPGQWRGGERGVLLGNHRSCQCGPGHCYCGPSVAAVLAA